MTASSPAAPGRAMLSPRGLREREPILRQPPVQVPRGAMSLLPAGATPPPGAPEAFAVSAAVLAVFRGSRSSPDRLRPATGRLRSPSGERPRAAAPAGRLVSTPRR